MRNGPILAGALAGALALTSCGALAEKATEKAIEKGTGCEIDNVGDTQVNAECSDGDLTLGGSDGNFTFSDDSGNNLEVGSGELPDDWPEDVPEPAGSEVDGAGSVSSPEGDIWNAVFSTDQNADEAADAYENALTDAGFEVDAQTKVSGGSVGGTAFTASNDQYDLTVSVSGESSGSGTTGIAVNIAEKPSASS